MFLKSVTCIRPFFMWALPSLLLMLCEIVFFLPFFAFLTYRCIPLSCSGKEKQLSTVVMCTKTGHIGSR